MRVRRERTVCGRASRDGVTLERAALKLSFSSHARRLDAARDGDARNGAIVVIARDGVRGDAAIDAWDATRGVETDGVARGDVADDFARSRRARGEAAHRLAADVHARRRCGLGPRADDARRCSG